MSLDVYLTRPVEEEGDRLLWEYNITHNLNTMAAAVQLYTFLWRPSEAGIDRAGQLVYPLVEGIQRLVLQKEELTSKYTPSNGWGSYNTLLDFCLSYLDACLRYPNADVRVSV